MRRAATVLCAALAGAIPAAAQSTPAMDSESAFAAILQVCEATTLDEAAARGGRLGWPSAPEDRNWRAGFERHNGGTVRVVGWRRGEREGDGLLSYWVASGPSAHRACSFTTNGPGLLEALRSRFGSPDTFEKDGDIVSAFWRRGAAEVSFTQVGASSGLTLSHRD